MITPPFEQEALSLAMSNANYVVLMTVRQHPVEAWMPFWRSKS